MAKPLPTKECIRCNETKYLFEFAQAKDTPDRLKRACKDCEMKSRKKKISEHEMLRKKYPADKYRNWY